MKKIHTVLILAGGDGDRFFPLEQKVQFRFNGKTVLHHVVSSVAPFAEQIIVITNHTNESAIKSDLAAYPVHYITQTSDKGGMADAVLAAKQLLVKDALILNGNDVLDFSIVPDLISQTIKNSSLVGFVAKYMKDYFPGGYVIFQNDKAIGIIEKPLPADIPSHYVRLVVDYFPDIAPFIKELEAVSSSDDQYERGMSALMKHKPVTCIKYEGDWATLKYSWQVLSMQEYFFTNHLKSMINPSVTVHKTAIIEGLVHMGKGVKIGAYCKITGPCYIGNNVIVGDHSLIRNSTIEQDSLVGLGCEVARSYLAQGVMLHRNYVGDSVLSDLVSMGAGAVTANYRFDAKTIKTPVGKKIVDSQKVKFGLIAGKEVKLGVNSATYPGVKLSAKTWVLPGEVVKKDK